MFDRLRFRLASAIIPKEMGAMFAQMGTRSAARRGIGELILSYRTSPIFRGVVSKISAHFAAVPWVIYAVADRRVMHQRARTVAEAVPGGRALRDRRIQEAYEPERRRRLLGEVRQQQQLVEIVDHPMTDLLTQAIPHVMTGLKARKLTQTYLDIAGETFWLLKLGPTGTPIEYWPIPPHWVQRIPEPSRPSYVINVQGTTIEMPADQVIWFRDIDPAEPYGRGSGIGLSLGDELESDEYCSKMIKTFFLNRGKPELLVGVKGITTAQAKAAKEEFEREHRGFWRAHRSWWHSGDITVKELQQKFTDMGLVELRTWERDAVISTYGVPPEILGILENSNRATITASRKIFVEEVLIPRLEDMRAELQMRLAPMFDERLIIDYEPPQPDDKELRLEALKSMTYAATIGEIREFLGLPHRGSRDDVHMVPFNLMPQRVPQEEPEKPAELMLNPPGVRGTLSAKTVKQPTFADLDNVLEALRPDRLTKELRPMWSEEFREWGENITEELGLDPAAFDMLNPLVVDHLNDFYTNRIADIDQTTLKQLRAALVEGVEAGEDIARLSKRVEGVFEVAKGSRAKMIARTETTRSSNAATYSAHVQSGVVEARQWIATMNNTRDTHLELNGMVVGINEEFFTENGSTMYPGDFGVAEEDVNCGCGTFSIIGPPLEEEAIEALFYKIDAERAPWRLLARRAFTRGFAKQEEDVLAALEAVE